jgi:serine/threonine protein kinase
MHSSNIVHRDIKPENILLEKVLPLEIKMTDFGFATYFEEKMKLNEVLGSPIYMAPEIVEKQAYDTKVDVWSAGCVAFIMLCGTPPFLGDSKQ